MTVTTASLTHATNLFTREHLFIAGEWVPAGERERIPVVNPYTEQVVGSVPEATEADADRAIAAAGPIRSRPRSRRCMPAPKSPKIPTGPRSTCSMARSRSCSRRRW